MASKVPLSVVILTKNEANRIRECLRSVEWADERLVVDDESTDETVRIAESLGARVLRRKMDIEGRHRNWAHTKASHEWILSLDADERVTQELAQEIINLFRHGELPYEIYSIPRRNYIGDYWIRYGGWYPSPQIKLFKRSVFRWEEAPVHPRAISDRPSGLLTADLIHYTYHDLADFISKMNRQTTLEAEKWFRDRRRMSGGKALWRTIDRFFRAYVGKQGYRDGFLGFLLAALGGWYQLLSYTKYLELQLGNGSQYLCSEITSLSLPEGISEHAPRKHETLAVVLITKNEEQRIAACLDRVKGWADEIIVIDDLSTDRTMEIARRYSDKVFSFASEGNHNRQRNRGIEQATADWVLHLDADEWVTPELKRGIDEILNDAQGYNAFEVMRKNVFLGRPMRYGGWYHRHLALFRRTRARCIGRGVHEHLQVDGKVGYLNANVEHHPFTSIPQFLERQNWYTSVEARIIQEEHGLVPNRTIWFQAGVRPLKLFWKFYVKKEGRKDGRVGFVFSVLFAFTHFLLWAKYWERSVFASSPCD